MVAAHELATAEQLGTIGLVDADTEAAELLAGPVAGNDVAQPPTSRLGQIHGRGRFVCDPRLQVRPRIVLVEVEPTDRLLAGAVCTVLDSDVAGLGGVAENARYDSIQSFERKPGTKHRAPFAVAPQSLPPEHVMSPEKSLTSPASEGYAVLQRCRTPPPRAGAASRNLQSTVALIRTPRLLSCHVLSCQLPASMADLLSSSWRRPAPSCVVSSLQLLLHAG